MDDQADRLIISNNEEKILKAYMFEGNKIQNEMSQMEHRQHAQEVGRVLEEQDRPKLECNQKIMVRK